MKIMIDKVIDNHGVVGFDLTIPVRIIQNRQYQGGLIVEVINTIGVRHFPQWITASVVLIDDEGYPL